MNDLAVLFEPYGRIGSLEQIMPEYLDPPTHDSGAKCTWSGAIGMVRTGKMKINAPYRKNDDVDGFGAVLSTILISSKNGNEIEFSEFYGTIFFKPIDGVTWGEQLSGFKQSPSMFEAVHPTQVQSNTDYVFYSRRAAKSKSRERRKL